MFKIEDFPGAIEEITVKHKKDEKKLRAKFVFEDSEYKITVTVEPQYEDLYDQFFTKIPYKLSLIPAIKQLEVDE